MSTSDPPLMLYALAAERSLSTVRRFVARWVPPKSTPTMARGVLQFGQGAETPADPDEMDLAALIADSARPHALYWPVADHHPIAGAQLFFTIDAALIAGLAVALERNRAARLLPDLAESVGARYGCILPAEPPHDTVVEFLEFTRLTPPPKLVDGQLIPA